MSLICSSCCAQGTQQPPVRSWHTGGSRRLGSEGDRHLWVAQEVASGGPTRGAGIVQNDRLFVAYRSRMRPASRNPGRVGRYNCDAGRPPRGCASRPGDRARANRLRHLLTIWGGVSQASRDDVVEEVSGGYYLTWTSSASRSSFSVDNGIQVGGQYSRCSEPIVG